MSNPQVTAIMLTADRQAQTDRAVRSFLGQTYRPSTLLIYDTGKERYKMDRISSSRIVHVYDGKEMSGPIGALRNRANGLAESEILIHFDSDDVSGPYRIQDQVKTLQDSGRDCVGYRSVMFWRTAFHPNSQGTVRATFPGEAWAYRNPLETYCIGASLCYWRKTWEQRNFKDTLPTKERGIGEDREWLRHINSLGDAQALGTPFERNDLTPRLVCEIHGANTMDYDLEAMKERGDTFWTRQPEWDAKLQAMMAL